MKWQVNDQCRDGASYVASGHCRPLLWIALLLITPCIVAAGETALQVEIEREEAQLEQMLTRYTDKHPDVVAARAKLSILRARRSENTVPASTVVTSARRVEPALSSAPAATIPKSKASVPRARERESRAVNYEDDFAVTCARFGVVACFDFEGADALASQVGRLKGELVPGADGKVRARVANAGASGGGHVVRMDFRAADAADHGAFVFYIDRFQEGDRLTVQWRQWFAPSLITRFDGAGARILPTIGGDGPKQLSISEIGDPEGCSFGDLVVGNAGWLGTHVIYHGCGLWYRPTTPAPAGPQDPSDMDVQPGGDNVCRYRYYGNSLVPGVDYLYPTVPSNLLDVPELSAVVNPRRYHGCLGIEGGQWMTFRLELDIAYCRAQWVTADAVPEVCRKTPGQLRYWVKFATDKRPWLVYDYPMPLRWRPGHSERYGRFMFTPYNTNEVPLARKPLAYTLYDDILVARNVPTLPWPRN